MKPLSVFTKLNCIENRNERQPFIQFSVAFCKTIISSSGIVVNIKSEVSFPVNIQYIFSMFHLLVIGMSKLYNGSNILTESFRGFALWDGEYA